MTKYGIDLESDEAHLLEFFAKTGGYGSVESYLKYLFTYGDGMMNQIVSDMLDDYRKRGEKFCMEEGVTKEEVETVIQCIARLKKIHPERYKPKKFSGFK